MKRPAARKPASGHASALASGSAAPVKRPASRGPWPNEQCEGEGCAFSTTVAGQPARVQPDRAESHCAFCSCEAFDRASSGNRPKVLQMLKKIHALDPENAKAALRRVEGWKGKDAALPYWTQLGYKMPAPQSEWPHLLARRQLLRAPLDEDEAAEYEAKVRADRRQVRRKVLCPEHKGRHSTRARDEIEEKEVAARCGAICDVAPNDAGLPAPSDPKARMAEQWCKRGSWAMCEQCHSMQARPFLPVDLKKMAKPTITAKACTACSKGEYVPQLEDVPVPLRALLPTVIEALRPIDVDTGPEVRAPHGYRVHMAPITFAWAATSVKQKIEALETKQERRAARAALRHLLDCRDSEYFAFHAKHEGFLRRRGDDAALSVRKRPLRFIEQSGLECALWPHLYWHRNLCETVARMSHEERQARKRHAAAADSDTGADSEEDAAADDSGEDAGDDDAAEGKPKIEASKLGRLRRGFMRKVLSPVVGYGTDYELLHFVYDLSMWTTVGTKKNIARQYDVPLRAVLKGCPWTPQYWKVRHQAVVDMQRQCGNATLFRTRAPYEKSFPYHEWVLHEMRLAGRPRMHLPGAETLHQAHVLMELDKAFISGARGATGRADRLWQDQHIFGAQRQPGEDGPLPQTVLNRVTRLEFQDGKRKRGTQAYHGRGTTHSHSLDFLQNLAAIKPEDKISAHLPDKATQPLLHGLVLDGQCDRSNSGVPVREEPSAFDAVNGKVLLQHTEEDKELKIRPYLKTTLEVTKCHEDVQQADGNGAVLRYVATYSLKFSDSMDQDWLNDQASDYSVARRILFSHHPLEAEMWLTLGNERFPQVDFKGTLVDINVPLPGFAKKPRWLQQYESATWRREDMSVLEYLRKTSMYSGDVIRHIKEGHKQHVRDALELFFVDAGQEAKDAAKESNMVLKAYTRHWVDSGKDLALAGTLAEFVHALGRRSAGAERVCQYVCAPRRKARRGVHLQYAQ